MTAIETSIREFISKASSSNLNNPRSRRRLAGKICSISNFWNGAEMLQFVEEMRGLDFSRSEDRVIFCDFLFSWMEGADESFNA